MTPPQIIGIAILVLIGTIGLAYLFFRFSLIFLKDEKRINGGKK